jgi:hypothetical protein
MRILAMAALAACLAVPAAAHGPYTTLKHPRSGYPCCNGFDCAKVDSERVEPIKGGFLVDRKHFVAEKDVIPSWDGDYHACFWPPPDTLRCLVVPTTM